MKAKLLITIIFSTILATASSAQQKGKGVDTVNIRTSAVCEMCKKTIENGMAYEKGVKKSSLNTETKILTVWYRSDKTTVDELRKAVNEIGYDADSIPAETKAYERLDECCKKGYHK